MCKHFIGTMRLHYLGSILSVLLRLTVFSALLLGPLSANAADVKIDGAEGLVTATQDKPPSIGGATTASPGESPSSSAQNKAPFRDQEAERKGRRYRIAA